MPSKREVQRHLVAALEELYEANRRLTEGLVANIDMAKHLLKVAGELGIVPVEEVSDGLLRADTVAKTLELHLEALLKKPSKG